MEVTNEHLCKKTTFLNFFCFWLVISFACACVRNPISFLAMRRPEFMNHYGTRPHRLAKRSNVFHNVSMTQLKKMNTTLPQRVDQHESLKSFLLNTPCLNSFQLYDLELQGQCGLLLVVNDTTSMQLL
jgi:hypothetical protein